MKLSRMFLALVAVLSLVGVAYVQQATEPAGAKMADAAQSFLATLDGDTKAKATFAYDDKERFNYHFIPLQDKEKKSTRKGLPMEQMTAKQKEAALSLLKSGTSASGYLKATTIMSLESILRDLEKDNGAMVRNPGWYFVTVFGTPSKTGKWGWRVEGHHLSLNFTLDGGTVVSATPAFFGCNPADVKDGDRKGLKALAESDDLGRELVMALTDDQKKVAILEKQHPEVQGQTSSPKLGDPQGITADKLNDKQRAILNKLLDSYAERMTADVAEKEIKEAHSAAPDKVYFSWWGGVEPGKPHSYRVHGPTFAVEFLNVQEDAAKNPANHIHSAWRSLKNDFGGVAN